MLISKKELLEETGISYGQLYRWKRERLIPEEWFIKRPSFTGQETFFPRQKMLQRIRTIQELKDKYSLEELSKILSPELADRNFTAEELAIIEEIDSHLLSAFEKGFDKNNFSFIEVLLMAALTDCYRELNLPIGTVIDLTAGLKGYVDKIKSTGFMLVVFDSGSEYYSTLYAEQTDVFLDSRLRIAKTIRLNDLSSQIKLKYRKRFNFRFDEQANDSPDDGGLQFSY